MPLPLIVGVKKAGAYIAGKSLAVCGAAARAARAPRATPRRPRPEYGRRVPLPTERARTATQTATAQRAAAVRAGLARGGAGRVRPPATGKKIDYRVPVYGGTAAVAAYGVGTGVDKAGEGIRDVGAGIAKATPALPFITVIILAIVGLIGLKYFRRRR